jgi:hypothetical protein
VELVVYLVHPAMPIGVARGEPDCSKPVGAPNTTAVWETWRLARTEVFLADGSQPPAWDDLSLPHGYLGTTPGEPVSPHDPNLSLNQRRTLLSAINPTIAPTSIKILFDPFPDNGVFVDSGGIGETHLNHATYDFIRDNCLFSKDGLQRYAAAVDDSVKPPITFPIDSIEVKAVWLKFAPSSTTNTIDQAKRRTYYSAKDDKGTEYGLVSLHVLTKDTPNWFWANFHHKDNPSDSYDYSRPDLYGRPHVLDGTVWQNYVLGGTQTDFIDTIGQPIKLADHYIEYGFSASSCMTCHVQANGSPEAGDTKGPKQKIAVGSPNPADFMRNGKPFYVPTDFVWSIPFRAKPERNPPPVRCIWEPRK